MTATKKPRTAREREELTDKINLALELRDLPLARELIDFRRECERAAAADDGFASAAERDEWESALDLADAGAELGDTAVLTDAEIAAALAEIGAAGRAA